MKAAARPVDERAPKAANSGRNAGVSFTALREASAFPQGLSARELYAERMDELLAALDAMDTGDPKIHHVGEILQSQAARLRSTLYDPAA